ncbi:hypothetical protein EHI8A_027160 [Entamoeba histolytica HM-1:IMSS-B]|uniref:Uncharacterized protein n=6 Tax=Entamoeba histolytica TaxID=5759 RepID=C4M776_ENTH1|nr:hypothetical protein EHI_199650 [Entamoeba histolytica HM-1:IMSS]EMD43307.1 Hypothetical protein EHI5A_052760 [Entamoeba histolytica KU27]EMH76058.1 hypothetical protein EHI8A_027160 [Entamoeba histolytica HM-1:IMSS-B]EMS13078.1 hypothetical protein KM1_064030 [Entamoeba histolytica HM-3:IMSS]ENY62182.1 hypothetical protein EHI7A_029950 [Entamoeba histolytica HM-1:IMSS-A]GAT97371.1 hypothetical protein CL6EHI_199650 [Entamoeba histolytica]|eukprot:XP_654743.1 hypothetical protein EHI_199650 [Entamoeba histolytica HM-1:IMSS]
MNTTSFTYHPQFFISENLTMNCPRVTQNFFSAPNTLFSRLKTLSPEPLNTQQGQTLEFGDIPMEEEESDFNEEVFDFEDDEFSDETDETNDLLASQLIETVENIRKQSEERNKILKNIVSMNSSYIPPHSTR